MSLAVEGAERSPELREGVSFSGVTQQRGVWDQSPESSLPGSPEIFFRFFLDFGLQ